MLKQQILSDDELWRYKFCTAFECYLYFFSVEMWTKPIFNNIAEIYLI